MNALRNEKSPMPGRDPNNWGWLLSVVASLWPSLYAAGMAFAIALIRGIHAGGKPVKTLLEALLCGCLTLALVPVLDYFGLPRDLAVAIGAAIAFMGVDWFRGRADAVARRLIDKWVDK
ncbi:phage holin, lambda family [Halomonas daqingensis]|uniref:Phage holin, lambda family n=1 Tax=Billgrantia desiderata TaxID=52021 RepID=A0ABS9B5V0_9GAMM|nr:phage holin, lambda family [Halomonas desiderata]MCE8042451.1 phage holin, lambda family [Halomonas desiderata]MCE8047026.1 phage holin, lambda family [Halomonas desiderata]